jgi:hypothetical protein
VHPLQVAGRARAATAKAREVVAKVRPAGTDGRRSLPVRAPADQIRARWNDPEARRRVLDGIPVREASLETGREDGDWGTIATVRLSLSAPVLGMAAQTLAGKAVRRLKALCETGEVPRTDFNPSARPDAGEPGS